MVKLNLIEEKQLNLLKREIMNCPRGNVVYPRDLLRKYGERPYGRVIRRLVEEINSGIETTIKLWYPKTDVWKVYWM